MADIFSSRDVVNLLNNKTVMLVGDSNMRAMYKDLVTLVSKNMLMDQGALRKRGEPSFEGDKRTLYSGLSRGRDYVEAREYKKYGIHLQFQFTTRCYNKAIEKLLEDIKANKVRAPDVFVMNSCIWDISRWGPNGVNDFKENMRKLLNMLQQCLPESTHFIWTTTLPVSRTIRGGLLIKQIDFLQPMLRFEIMEANLFCRKLVAAYHYDVLDIHYHLRMQIHRRLRDGIHYGPLPVRFVSNLLLTHLSLSWGIMLPGNYRGSLIERLEKLAQSRFQNYSQNDEPKLPQVPRCLILSNKRDSGKQEIPLCDQRNKSCRQRRKEAGTHLCTNVQPSLLEDGKCRPYETGRECKKSQHQAEFWKDDIGNFENSNQMSGSRFSWNSAGQHDRGSWHDNSADVRGYRRNQLDTEDWGYCEARQREAGPYHYHHHPSQWAQRGNSYEKNRQQQHHHHHLGRYDDRRQQVSHLGPLRRREDKRRQHQYRSQPY